MIRVLLVEDHASFRQALAFFLQRDGDIVVTGQAGSVAAARGLSADVDVAIVDLHLGDGDGADLVRELRAVNPSVTVVALSATSNLRHLARVVEAGAAGVLNKAAPIADIVEVVRRLAAGESLVTPREIMEFVGQDDGRRGDDEAGRVALAALTNREREMLQALADGLSDRQIAERLFISTDTVKRHMGNLFKKMGVDSRLQALVVAVRHDAVTIER